MRSLPFALLLVAGPALADPRTEMVYERVAPDRILQAANTNIIFLNRCASGCLVRQGTTDSRTNYSSISRVGQGNLSPFSHGDTVWNNVVSCVRDVFTPFGVQIVTTDPAPANHFEIMIAGTPQQLGFTSATGGVSPFDCNAPYIPNSLVFDFDVWGSDVEKICSVAAQEIAHSFRLDHVTDMTDPLTYFDYSARKRFKDAQVQCGSDCFDYDNNGTTPLTNRPPGQGGYTCTGTNQQSHPCSCNGFGDPNILTNTQNSVAVIKALFGAGTPTPPNLTITTPKTGDNVKPGFAVAAEATDDNGIGMVELRVDGQLTGPPATQFPYVFNAPSTLGDGTHTVQVTAYDNFGANSVKMVQVVIGKPCTKPSECPNDTDTCVGGRCVAGPGVQGGLGTACTENTMCASGQCAADSSGAMYCVEVCDPTQDQCPSGFTCLQVGGGGVCWPGDDGGGCCETGGPKNGMIGFGLLFMAWLWSRRRRPCARS